MKKKKHRCYYRTALFKLDIFEKKSTSKQLICFSAIRKEQEVNFKQRF